MPRFVDIDLTRLRQRQPVGDVVSTGVPTSLLKASTASVEKIAVETAFNRYPAIFRAVRAIYSSLAMAPLVLLRKRHDGEKVPDTSAGGQVLQKLLWRPNSWLAGNDLIEWVSLWQQLREALLWMRFPAKATWNGVRYSMPPVELQLLPPAKVTAQLESGRLMGWNLRRPTGKQEFIPWQDIVRIAMPNAEDDVRGLGPAGPAFQDADTGYAAKITAGKFFERGVKPSAVLSVKGEVDAETRQAITEKISKLYSGVENSEGVIVIGADASLQLLSQAKDMDFRGLLEYSDRQVMMAFGVPPVLMGSEDATRANADSQLRMFAEVTLAPLWEDIAAKLSFGLAKHFTTEEEERSLGELLLSFDTSGHPFLQENRREFADTAVKISDAVVGLVEAGIARRAEARAIGRRAGLAELEEEGDELETESEGEEIPAEDEDGTDGEVGAEASRVARARKAVLQAKKAALRRVEKGARTAREAVSRSEVRRLGRVFGQEAAETLVGAIHRELGDAALGREELLKLVGGKFDELLEATR